MKKTNRLIKLVELRKMHNLSCQDLSKILNISKSYYWQLEQGNRNLYYKLAIDIAKYFKLKPDDLFYDDLK